MALGYEFLFPGTPTSSPWSGKAPCLGFLIKAQYRMRQERAPGFTRHSEVAPERLGPETHNHETYHLGPDVPAAGYDVATERGQQEQ